MTKLIALQSYLPSLANILIARGYQVIVLPASCPPGALFDALLYTSYHPDHAFFSPSPVEAADITLGSNPITTEFPSAIMLNITGMHPIQVADALDQQLRHKHWKQ